MCGLAKIDEPVKLVSPDGWSDSITQRYDQVAQPHDVENRVIWSKLDAHRTNNGTDEGVWSFGGLVAAHGLKQVIER